VRINDAAALFAEITRLAPMWPNGHYNYALVLGELGLAPVAMTEMKRFLMLAPDAPNKQRAQDKIFEWERKAGR
jgi:hypothetical protein